LAALVLIALVAWVIAPHIGYRIATTAYVNAELQRVSSPIAGELAGALPQKGEVIEASTKRTLVVAFSQDQRTFLRLAGQIASAKERADLERAQLKEIAAADGALADRGQVFREGIIAKLTGERDEAKAEGTGCLTEFRQRSEVSSRMEQLVKGGTASQIRAGESLAAKEAVATRCAMVEAKLRRLEAELAAAQAGVFLRDGINDAPYSQQQRDRLAMRRQEIETKLLEDEQQSADLATTEMETERDRLNGLNTFSVVLPAQHVVWDVAASPGSMVAQGQILFDLADCDKRFVVVEVPERDFEAVVAGEFVDVRLIGGGDWRRGKVQQSRGPAAQSSDRLLAAQAPRPNRESVTVEITFPNDPAQLQKNTFCSIGRTAEVRVQRFGSNFLVDWVRQLQQLVGYRRSDAVADLDRAN
jgi:multidrug resistance efflux pump